MYVLLVACVLLVVLENRLAEARCSARKLCMMCCFDCNIILVRVKPTAAMASVFGCMCRRVFEGYLFQNAAVV